VAYDDDDIFECLWLAMTRVIVLHIHLYGYLTVLAAFSSSIRLAGFQKDRIFVPPQQTISTVASVSETGKKALTQQLNKTSSSILKANPTLR
jgi:hypothetical protein